MGSCASIFMLLGLHAHADYLKDIKPVLKERCYACHGALKQKADLRLDTAERIHDVVKPGHPEASTLLIRLTHPNPEDRMPPEGKPLTSGQIEAIRSWIEQGAPPPENELGEEAPLDHWAFQRIERPPVPDAAAGNPIDAILAARQKARGLKAQPAAPRPLLIRRLYLDLIGLPPTREQLRDQRPVETIIDELLASPHHGERWARHWMDIWRYSDWYGLDKQLRYSQKHIWHWRDWIIEALNENLGYDRMIKDMLAADELAPDNMKRIRATGFLARNYYLFNRTTWLDSTIEHTGKAFLGLTLDCAKCHDHKYDPIEMTDYYRFRALFEPHQVRLDPVGGELDFEKNGIPRVFDEHLDKPTYLHRRGDPKQPDKESVIAPGVPAAFNHFAPVIKPVNLPLFAYAPGARPEVEQPLLDRAQAAIAKAEEELTTARKARQEKKPEPVAEVADFFLEESFDHPEPERWINGTEAWTYEGGQVHHRDINRNNALLKCRLPHPRDFQMTYRFTTTGGATYKSIGVRFDLTEDEKGGVMFYTSAHAPMPKIQVALLKNGKMSYPADGRVSHPIKVGETYTVKLALRDRLLNVWLNDQFMLAYTLPSRRPGHFAFTAFDAGAAIDSLLVRSLPADIKLTGAKNKPAAPTPDDRFQQAQLGLEVAKAEATALLARIKANKARRTSA
ncbi:MAG: DUF1549 domain-containing protein, partial [Verrucomicrobiota bacterium]